VSQWIASYGYWAVFALVALESLGIPLPGETALIIAGVAAGHAHRLNPVDIFLVASAAAIIGDNIGYWIGRTGGYRLARRYGHWVRLGDRQLKAGRYLFDRHGGKVVLFGRFVSVLRTYAAFLAGVSAMRWRRFLVFNAIGGILWAATYTFLAYFLGSAFQSVSGTISWILAGAAVAALVTVIVLVRHQISRIADKASALYPDPVH
jgi:membrane protein DedA with SNARE-associated domain